MWQQYLFIYLNNQVTIYIFFRKINREQPKFQICRLNKYTFEIFALFLYFLLSEAIKNISLNIIPIKKKYFICIDSSIWNGKLLDLFKSTEKG